MSEWVVKNLDEVVEYFIDYRGKTPVKTGSGIPLITAKIVKDGCLQTPTEFISVEDYPLWMTRGYPEVNDVVLTTEAPLGEVALIKNKNVALAQRIITLRGYKNILDNKFLKYWLQSEQGQYELESRASGTTVFGIKSSILKKIPISLPPYNEQVAISSVLYSIDEKIDLLHRQNKTLESMAETLFRQWFILDSTGVSVSIDQIIDFNPKRTLIKSQDATYLDMAGLSTVIFRANGYYRRPFSSGTKFTKRDTLLARITPCLENGKAAYIDFLDDNETGWGSTEFIVMRPKKEIHP
ncbi:TPA: restriction endonuclease subunit S, partial [Enterobacter roggenkampii]|nr:restriction endonuclease subunit S [Enterobacter roggenkampii]